jgi:hypothetical protein
MLTYAIEAGRELAAVKAGLPHGQFQSWCAANLSFSYRTAADYMRMAKDAARCTFDPDTSIRGALEALATPRPPSPPPQLTREDAAKLLRISAHLGGGNAHEEAVAQETLDKMAARFGMTGEEAQ